MGGNVKHRVAALIPFGLLVAAAGAAVVDTQTFESASSVEEVRRQIGKLPKTHPGGTSTAWIWPGTTGTSTGSSLRSMFTAPVLCENSRAGRWQISPTRSRYPGRSGPIFDFLNSDFSTCMGMVILHDGKIVFEDYPRMEPYERPIYWSVTKVLVSAVVSILEDRGQVEIDKGIETYIPELSGSSYAGITVRNILDMATGVDCPEEYYDRDILLLRADGDDR